MPPPPKDNVGRCIVPPSTEGQTREFHINEALKANESSVACELSWSAIFGDIPFLPSVGIFK